MVLGNLENCVIAGNVSTEGIIIIFVANSELWLEHETFHYLSGCVSFGS